MNKTVTIMKNQFNLAFSMICEFIDVCPDELWEEKLGGHIFWQQLLHTYTGTNFWFRIEKLEFIEPFNDKNVYPELEHDAEICLTKRELRDLIVIIENEIDIFFIDKEDVWLISPNVLFANITNLDVISMQIRHIMYHVGYCNCLLNQQSSKTVEWKDYFGKKEKGKS